MGKFSKKLVIAFMAMTTVVLSATAVACKKDDTPKCVHDWGETATQVVKDPTCMEKGIELWTCGKCGEEKQKEIPKTEHNLEPDGIVTEESSCMKTGTLLKKCMTTDCTYTKTEKIERKEHIYVEVPELKATCTTAGYDAYSYCKDCKTYGTAKRIQEALGHDTNKRLPEVKPTCTVPGKTEGIQCVRCDEILQAQTTVPAMGHTEVVVKGYPSSCGTGLTDGRKCGVCNAVLVEQIVIPATGEHSETATRKAIPATCTSVGSTALEYCLSCGETVSGGEEIPMIGHNLVDGYCTVCNTHEHTMVTKYHIPATCTESGKSTGRYCTTCEYIEREQEILPPLGHGETYQYGEDIEATCTTDGASVGLKCIRCDTILKEAKIIPAKGHIIEKGDCTVCDYKHTHNLVNGDCTICDYVHTHEFEKCKCTICGYTDHNFEEWTTLNKANCSAAEEVTSYCTKCNNQEIRRRGEKDPHTHLIGNNSNLGIYWECIYCGKTCDELGVEKKEGYVTVP